MTLELMKFLNIVKIMIGYNIQIQFIQEQLMTINVMNITLLMENI